MFGNVAIGLTFAVYKVFLLPLVNFLSALNTVDNPPLFKPAGANHVSDEASLNAYTPGINVEAGTQTLDPKSGSIVCNHGQYVAPYEESIVAAFSVTVARLVAKHFTVSTTAI